jgi:hypothetical protein
VPLPPESSQPLTEKRAFAFWSPLALSWLCMAAEAPICLAIISRSPDAAVNTAAMQAMFAIAIFIEAPVIDLLSTSTTLGSTRRRYVALSRFAWTMMLWVTAIHALVAWTPLYDWVTLGALRLDPAVAEATHWPLRILTLWSAFIGWRRHLQGIMIRGGETRAISVGTLLRVVTVGAVGWSLHLLTPLGGLLTASIALMASVAAESLFIHFLSRGVVARRFGDESHESAEEDITQTGLLAFHLPLTGATMVTLITGPMMSAALARSEDPVINMAAFQLGSSITWLFRTAAFALPEAVIALGTNQASRRIMRNFSLKVGLALSGSLAFFHFTGLDRWWLETVLGAEPSLLAASQLVVLLGVFLPLLGAAMAYLRGCLTSARVTWGRLAAIGAGASVLAICLVLGVIFKVPGLWNASLAALAAQLAELGALGVSWKLAAAKILLAAEEE